MGFKKLQKPPNTLMKEKQEPITYLSEATKAQLGYMPHQWTREKFNHIMIRMDTCIISINVNKHTSGCNTM